jgi:hypothetical protein
VKCGKWKNTTVSLVLLTNADRVLITLGFEATTGKEFMGHCLQNIQQTHTQEKENNQKKRKKEKKRM